MQIRHLTEDDLEAVLPLRAVLFPEDDGEVWPLYEYTDGIGLLVGAEHGGRLIGYAAAQLRSHAEGAWERPAAEQRIAYLEEWFVDEGHRHQGVGRALIAEVESWARGLRCSHLASDTEVGNELSVQAHAALGFSVLESITPFLKRLDHQDPGPAASGEVTLQPIGEANGSKVMELQVAPSQVSFVASNLRSMARASFSEDAWVRAVHVDDEPVGFVMVSVKPNRCYLWRYMIDARYQGQGHGRLALELVCDEMRSMGYDRMYTSVVPGTGGPGPFYEKLGFTYTGEKDGLELELVLEL